MLNKQELFNTMSRHLLKQKKRSLDNEDNPNTCAYKTDDGLKCAIGCLIKDEDYSTALENKTVTSEIVLQSLSNSLDVSTEDLWEEITFLQGFQLIHDTHDVKVWKESLATLSVKYNLNADVLDEY